MSARRDLNEALIGTGIPHFGRGDVARWSRIFGAIAPEVAGFAGWARPRSTSPGSRQAGSTVSGKTISTSGIRAAGVLLVKEAGGFVTDYRGQDRMFEQREYPCRQRTSFTAQACTSCSLRPLRLALVASHSHWFQMLPAIGGGVLESRQYSLIATPPREPPPPLARCRRRISADPLVPGRRAGALERVRRPADDRQPPDRHAQAESRKAQRI